MGVSGYAGTFLRIMGDSSLGDLRRKITNVVAANLRAAGKSWSAKFGQLSQTLTVTYRVNFAGRLRVPPLPDITRTLQEFSYDAYKYVDIKLTVDFQWSQRELAKLRIENRNPRPDVTHTAHAICRLLKTLNQCKVCVTADLLESPHLRFTIAKYFCAYIPTINSAIPAIPTSYLCKARAESNMERNTANRHAADTSYLRTQISGAQSVENIIEVPRDLIAK